MHVWYVGREENNSFPYVMRKVLSYQDIIPYSFEYLMVLLSGFALSSSKRLIKAAGGERVSVFRWKYQIDGEIKQTKLDFTPDWCRQGHQTHCGTMAAIAFISVFNTMDDRSCFPHMLENRPLRPFCCENSGTNAVLLSKSRAKNEHFKYFTYFRI